MMERCSDPVLDCNNASAIPEPFGRGKYQSLALLTLVLADFLA
jgi:hypothetical protein